MESPTGSGHPHLLTVLSERAQRTPRARAFTFLDDGERTETPLDYATLHERAGRIAERLRTRVEPGERVVLLYPYHTGLDFIAAFFGCLYAKVIAVPAYPPDPNRLAASGPRLRQILLDCGARIALVPSPQFAQSVQRTAVLQAAGQVTLLATDDLSGSATWCDPTIEASDVAFLQYTSGSTAAPRGVAIRHANIMSNLERIERILGPSSASVGVGWMPLYHDMGLIGNVLSSVYTQMHMVLMSPLHVLQRPVRWLQAVGRFGATHSGAPNFAYDMCLRRITEEQRQTLDLRTWSVAFNGAEPVRAQTVVDFAKTFGPCGFELKHFHICYGMAEYTLLIGASTPRIRRLSRKGLAAGRAEQDETGPDAALVVSSGNANDTDGKLRIVDPERREPPSPGHIGEIWLHGPSVADAYWGNPSASEATFHNTLNSEPGARFLRPGDLGYIDAQGYFYVVGRSKDVLIVRGRKLHAADVEQTVERSHAALRAGTAAAFSVEAGGEESFVVSVALDLHMKSAAKAAIDAILQALAATHEARPHAIVLLRPGGVRKTTSGKIQRQATRAAYMSGGLDAVATWQAPADSPA